MNLRTIFVCGCGCAIQLLAMSAATARPAAADDPEIVERVFHINARASAALHELRGERDEDPIRFIAGDMTGIMGDLSRYITDKPVQVKQEKVVGELDYLIAVLERQCK